MATRNTELIRNGLTCGLAIVNIGLLWSIHNQQTDINRINIDLSNAIHNKIVKTMDKKFDDLNDRIKKY